MVIFFLIFQIVFFIIMAPFVIFWGPFQAIKLIAVGTVYTSRHPQVLRIFLSQQDIDNIIHQNDKMWADNEQNIAKGNAINPSDGIVIEDIQGRNDATYGYAPRTAIGQKADGTIIFIVIDGRQPTWSMGACMSDLYNIFRKYDAINAANLDGGSSSEMVYNRKVLNRLWDIFGERYIPTAFVVMPSSN